MLRRYANMKPSEISAAWMVLEMAGLKAPAVLLDPKSHDVALDVWLSCLSDVDGDDLKRAAVCYIRSGERFWPTPGQLLQHLPARQLEKLDDSDRAWGWLIKLVSSRGNYQGPPTLYSQDGAKDAAIRDGVRACGGWQALCFMGPDDNTAARASFRAAYRSTMEQARIEREDVSAAAALGQDVGHGLRLLKGDRS